MAELITDARISGKIEDLISGSGEFVCLICPYLYHLPALMIKDLKKADERGVRVVLIYKKGLVVQGKEIEKLETIKNVEIYCSERLHAKAYFNEQEGIVTSFNLLSGEASGTIEFGVHFSRAADPSVYDQLLSVTEVLKKDSMKMRADAAKLVEIPSPKIIPERRRVTLPEGIVVESKKLNPREKQTLILDLLTREAGDCLVKVENQERLRIQGPGIVIFTNKDRIEIIFVRYGTFNSCKEQLKEFLQVQHPGLQVWVTYNRITFTIDKSDEVISLFYTMKDGLSAFGLA